MSPLGNGTSYPLGATITPSGVNFSIHSKSCTSMELLLFDSVDDAKPTRVIQLDEDRNHTFHYWHVLVEGVRAGQKYAYRADGPFLPSHGLRFDKTKILLDPYGRVVDVPDDYRREAAIEPGENTPYAMKSVVADLSTYDWEGDLPLRHPFNKTIIYEMHVGGFTKHPSANVLPELRGTFSGLVEKIPYLQDLGITAVELLPVFQFDPQEAPAGLTNYWGYNPVSFFAPHSGYGASKSPLQLLDEFRDMVKALHRANIEVLLDVVYNHTAEGGENGPTFCFKGLENSAYYILDRNPASRHDRSRYANFSGCGNTLNGNHAIVRRMILSSLRYWVEEMHVDGFRFDLASVLSRDENGCPQASPPILWDIETDPVLSGTKLIAEAWDASGLYQVGSFFGDHWKEWNGRFRDDVRSFVKSDAGYAGVFSKRLLASPDLYEHQDREPEQSINFVTSHDGFTLNDLVSYNVKHNEANLEDNRDGCNANYSWNCGVEGPTEDPQIEKLRAKQIKNFLTINLLAFGVPMLVMGDEMRRSQNGNNNSYCQDTEWNWLDWSLLKKQAGLHRFVKGLIKYRKNLPLRSKQDISLNDVLTRSRVRWHGSELGKPDWGSESRSVALTIERPEKWFYLIFNAFWEPMEFQIPIVPDAFEPWNRVVDTDLPSPHDIGPGESLAGCDFYRVQDRSTVILTSVQKEDT
ncbi:Glycogen debranching enzyme [Novipirellula artificiosorum]|uniref:Glycogen debranching enzyme n=2 Tax=Novipirellula artificiosorum TaxID=2528016 RepID=A0A5C6DB71_9BACT|nr:Glycogen debranching enzyme [Novipirellula artificiosorum]